jgi:tetratricopeptide (TPR) repeat protein
LQLAPSLRRPVWSPRAIAGMALLCTFVPAGILYAINWTRLGRRSLAPLVIAMVVAGLAGCAILTSLGHKGVFIDASVVASPIFWLTQEGAFHRHLARGAERARLLRPAIFAALFEVTLLACIATPIVIRDRLFNRAAVADKAGDFARAEELYAAYARKAPDDPELHWNLEVLYEETLRWDEAVAEAEWLAARDFRDSRRKLEGVRDRRRLHLGIEKWQHGDLAGAVAVFVEYAGKHPDDPAVHNNLAWCYVELRRIAEARAELTRLRQMDPAHKGITDLMARVDAAESVQRR